jgi:hypothetical protein
VRNAFNIVMRIFSTLLSVLAGLLGLIWIGQGLHIGPAAIMKSFMTSHIEWAVAGVVVLALSLAHIYWTNTRRA